MPAEVTDPAILAQLNGPQEVTDPSLLAQLNGKPATANDRVQAGEAGFLKGAAYLATLPVDTAANIYNLHKAAEGYVAGQALGTPAKTLPARTPQGLYHFRLPTGEDEYSKNAPPAGSLPASTYAQPNVPSFLQNVGGPSPAGAALTGLMDKNPVTSTQPNRPDDTASRYLAAAGSVVPGVLSGGGGLGGIARGLTGAVPSAVAGQYVADKKPFSSDWANNAASIAASSAVLGMAPRGTGADVAGNEVRNQTIRDAQEAGMVFPPATTNPSGGNRAIENIAGKQQVQQHATLTNRDAVNAAARSDLGIGGQGGISDSELSTVKANAKPAYDAVRGAGQIATGSDPNFVQSINGAMSKFTGASNVLSNAGDSGIKQDVADILAKPSADAGHLVDTIGILRDRSKTAFRQGDAGIGAAYSQVSHALEQQIQGQLPQGSPILQNYQAARKQLAVAHSVEDARNEGSGDVNAQKLASQLGSGVPLSGSLLTAAKAARLAPKAFAPVTDSKGVNHLGLWGSILGPAMAAHEVAPHSPHLALGSGAAVGAAQGGRMLSRMYALGPGQSNAIAKQRGPLDKNALIGSYLATQGKNQ